jgi:Integrase core domain
MARAVAERFFQLLKRERIRRRTSLTREAARQDVFDYIGMFYNPKRKHTNNGMLAPVDFETRQQKLNEAGVQETRGTTKPCHAIPLRPFKWRFAATDAGHPSDSGGISDSDHSFVTFMHLQKRQRIIAAGP